MDANSMERLAGESDSEYIARQSALRDQASARMRDKFGGANRMQVREAGLSKCHLAVPSQTDVASYRHDVCIKFVGVGEYQTERFHNAM